MSIFSSVSMGKAKSSKFDLSHEVKLSGKMGTLYPILTHEVLPGDSINLNSEVMIRFAPMLAPIMHRVNVYTHYFFVPNRIIWNEWKEFITGGKNGDAAPLAPYMEIYSPDHTKFGTGTLADYLGIPPIEGGTASKKINSLPFRAYQEIYNEYYRDQNLSEPVYVPKVSGADNASIASLTALRKRAWEKDYFTSALPWAQRGPEVSMEVDINYKQITEVRDVTGNPPVDGETWKARNGNVNSTTDSPRRFENIEDAGITINELRRSARLQEWLEKNARGGARYVEQLLSHWGVISEDSRLQRPEYLGGGKQPVVISEVLSTYDNTAGGLPQGEMTGHGISVGASHGFKKKQFKEHGFVIGILSVIPKTNYYQGLDRMWIKRFDKLDYAWPEFAQLGEQEIETNEIYFDGTSDNTETFGYQSRYADYKYKQSTIHGDFRTNLNFWHMARDFGAKPVLNENFVESDPTDRIFAVQDSTDNLWMQVYHNFSSVRKLPYYGTPKL